ncbi:MAG: hypothetical protein ACR2OJ_17210, partial [Hyphomicrobiales bacterium]
REIYNQVKKRFEEHGIAFARREVKVNVPGLDANEDLNDEQKDAIAGAASEAAQAAQRNAEPAKT